MAQLLLLDPPTIIKVLSGQTGAGMRKSPGTTGCTKIHMTGQTLIRLLEEMMEIKIRHYAPLHLKVNPEVAKLLKEKREDDHARLNTIRAELVKFLES